MINAHERIASSIRRFTRVKFNGKRDKLDHGYIVEDAGATSECFNIPKTEMEGFHKYMVTAGWIYSEDNGDYYRHGDNGFERKTIEQIIETYLKG